MDSSAASHFELTDLLPRAAAGERAACDELFSRYDERLRRMVRLRMNRRIQGRVDPRDILQDAYLEASRRLAEFAADPRMSFYLWLRHIVGEKLIDAHRRHLGAKMRDAAQEVSLHRGALPQANSVSLAAWLLGKLTSPSQAAIRAELRIRVQQTLNALTSVDREILALRHFEQMKNVEVAQVLGIDESTASTKYLRALKRMKDELSNDPALNTERDPAMGAGDE